MAGWLDGWTVGWLDGWVVGCLGGREGGREDGREEGKQGGWSEKVNTHVDHHLPLVAISLSLHPLKFQITANTYEFYLGPTTH
jgi:organic anion transporter 5A